MQEHHWWWPVALLGEAADRPVPLTLLGQRMVLWQGADGTLSLLADQCPHRGARLSMGSIQVFRQNPVLQCPYHGWQFDAQGHCVAIPALPGFCPPPSSAVRRFPIREAHGLLWALCGDPATSDLPLDDSTRGPPSLDGLARRRLIYGPFDVATSAPRAIENFLDTSHFAFVHAGFLGDSAHPEVPTHEVSLTADGRPVVEQYLAWQPKAHAGATGGAWVTYRYEVLSPFAALLTKRTGPGPQDGDADRSALDNHDVHALHDVHDVHQHPGIDPAAVEDSYVIWANPTEPESCRLWFAQYTSDNVTPEENLRDFQIAIFAQDQPILESQVPRRLPLSEGEAMSAADRLSAAYRRYLKACAITFGVC